MIDVTKKPAEYVKVSLSEDQIEKPLSKTCLTEFPAIIASIASFIAFIIYGACAGSLGASLPALAIYFNQSESRFGLVYTARGIGYFMSTIGSAAILELPSSLKNYKSIFVCIAALIIGVFTALIPISTNFHFVLMLIWLQGFGFGMIDTFANCLLPELWELRVGPWMQAMHCCFGIGAIIGPAMIGLWKFRRTFTFLGFSSIIPSIIIFFYHIAKRFSTSAAPIVSANESNVIENETSVSEVIKPPNSIKILLTLFFFVYVGAETSFGAWISAYVLNVGVTSSEPHAAYLASYFWSSLTFGRLIAIFLAICVSNTSMLRFQLVLCLASSSLMIWIASSNYYNASIVSIFYGFALSSMFPLVMTLVTDYGYTMDARTTSMFVVGATCGEALIPIAVGMIIDKIGLEMFPISILLCSVLLAALYLSSHLIAVRYGPKSLTNRLIPKDRVIKDDANDHVELIRSASGKTESTDFDDDGDIEGL